MKKKILLIVVTILISICTLFCMKIETFAALTCQHDGQVSYECKAKDSSTHYTKVCGECGQGFGTTEEHSGGTATCTAKAKCSKCGVEYGSTSGHSYTSKTTTSTYLKSSATCTSAAVYYYKCSSCTAKGTATYTSGSATGHNYFQKYNDTQHYMECSECGATKDYINHEWYGVSDSQHSCACGKMTSHTFSAATCTENKQCSECDWIMENSKLGHSWTKSCSSCGQASVICSRNSSHKKTHDCAITISANPSATSAKEGASATFSMTASGNNISYQWYYNNSGQSTGGTLVTGATSSSYTISSVTSDMNNRYYYCVVKNNSMSTSTTAAKLTVWYSHTISAQPVDVKVKKDETASFSVTATGGNPTNYTYQWYSATSSSGAGEKISGATSSTYSFAPTTNIHEKYYYCVVSNGYYDVTSNRAKLISDVTKPTLNVGTPSVTHANVNTKFTVPIIVTDTGEGLNISTFTASDIKVKVKGTEITPTIKELVYNSSSDDEYTYTLTLKGITGDGALTLEVPAESIADNFGNLNVATSMVVTGITIDNTKPVIALNGTVSGTNDGYVNDEATITVPIKITDAGGINSSEFTKEDITLKIGGTIVTDAEVTVTFVEKVGDDYKYTITIKDLTQEGELTLEIPEGKVTDKASNSNDKTVISNLQVIVDNTPPRITQIVLSLDGYNSSSLYPASLPSTNESWTNKNVYAVVVATDEGTLPSGVDTYYHSEGNTSNFVKLIADREIWQNEINNTVYYKVSDKAGNFSEVANVLIKIDKTSPIPAELNMKYNRENGLDYIYDVTNPASNSIYIKPNVTTDTGAYRSGVLKTEYVITFNDGAVTTVSEPIDSSISTLLKDTGTYKIEVITTDKAGNTASKLFDAIVEKKIENTVRVNNLHDEGSGIEKVIITARRKGATEDCIDPIVIIKPGANITERIKLNDGTFKIKVEIIDGVGLSTTLEKEIVNKIN